MLFDEKILLLLATHNVDERHASLAKELDDHTAELARSCCLDDCLRTVLMTFIKKSDGGQRIDERARALFP